MGIHSSKVTYLSLQLLFHLQSFYEVVPKNVQSDLSYVHRNFNCCQTNVCCYFLFNSFVLVIITNHDFPSIKDCAVSTIISHYLRAAGIV